MSRIFLPIYLRRAAGVCTASLALMAISPVFGGADILAQSSIQAKQGMVVGTVVDPSGEPVIGATVRTPDPKIATVTDIDGNFELKISKPTKLTITYVGYATQTVDAKPGQKLDITIKENAEMLNEVVVVGFGTQKKVNLTGAVGVATGKDIADRPVQNAVTALQGVIPGLNISNSSSGGELNASKSINVRGTSTIGEGSEGSPLILIDGMEGDLNTVNPQDIESISVLKDAAASSIYGSRAPFGVILVTTKKGAEGKNEIHYSNSFRWNEPLHHARMMNSWEYANYVNTVDLNTNPGSVPRFDAEELEKVRQYFFGESDYYADQHVSNGHVRWGSGENDGTYANVDWMKEYYKDTAFSQEHNVTFNGGTDKINYYLSGAYLYNGGFMRHGADKYDRFNIMGKFNAKITNWLSVGFTSKWTRSDYGRATKMSGGFYETVMRRAVATNPVYDPNGYIAGDYNYIRHLEDGGRHNEQNDVFSNQLSMTITPLKGWNIIAEFNTRVNNDWTHEESFPVYTPDADDPSKSHLAFDSGSRSSISEYSYRSTYLNWNVYTNYTLNFLDKNTLYFMVGSQIEAFKQRDLNAWRSDAITSQLPILNLTTGNDSFGLGGKYDDWRTAGFFGRINYDYDSKYLLEVNLRYDGSSRFRRDHRWVLSPSFSAGWNMAQESFWENIIQYVNTLKPRVSWGQLANQNTKSWYPTYRTMSVENRKGWLVNGDKATYAWWPGLITTDLTWEKIQTTNVGVDFGAFNNRLQGSFDYFWRVNKDMLGNGGIVLPAVFGATQAPQNVLKMRTVGWELQLSWRDRIQDFDYSVSVNLSDDRTKILEYPNREGYINTFIAGYYTGNIYGYETIGIAQTQEEMNAHLAKVDQSILGSDFRPGDIMYKDLDGNGKLESGNTIDDLKDLKLIGNNAPRYRIGFNLFARWKGIDVSAFFQGVGKRDYYFNPEGGTGTNGKNAAFWGAARGGYYESVFFKDHLDFWRDDTNNLGANYDAYYGRPIWQNNRNRVTQTRFLQNAAYLRLKNLQIGWTLPEKWVKAIKFNNIRVYFSAENLVTWTKMTKAVDPESLEVSKVGSGSSYPLSKTYSFGLQVDL